jgi:hypothetical protein
MPLLCAAGAMTAAAVGLLGEAGLAVPSQVSTFHDDAEYSSALDDLRSAGHRMVVQFVHPPGLLQPEEYWVAPELLSWLNDKASLAALVPGPGVPARYVVPPSGLADRVRQAAAGFPLVLKAASRWSTGAGIVDVHICRDEADLDAAAAALHDAEQVVVEEWLDPVRFLCLNFVVDLDAQVRYLGSAEIACGDDGSYHGNWLGEEASAAAALVEVGTGVAERGAALGYRGVLGVDIAEMPDGRCLAIDLNFRLNGSTASLLVLGARGPQSAGGVARPRTWTYDGPLADLAKVAVRALRLGMLVPLSAFDPTVHGLPDPARLSGLLMGESRADVARGLTQFEAWGLR